MRFASITSLLKRGKDAGKQPVPQPSLSSKTRALEVKKRKARVAVGTHQKESNPSKKKKIVVDEEIPSPPEESDERGAKVDGPVVGDAGKSVELIDLTSSRICIYEEDRASSPFMLKLLETMVDAGEGYSKPSVCYPAIEQFRGRRVSERALFSNYSNRLM